MVELGGGFMPGLGTLDWQVWMVLALGIGWFCWICALTDGFIFNQLHLVHTV